MVGSQDRQNKRRQNHAEHGHGKPQQDPESHGLSSGLLRIDLVVRPDELGNQREPGRPETERKSYEEPDNRPGHLESSNGSRILRLGQVSDPERVGHVVDHVEQGADHDRPGQPEHGHDHGSMQDLVAGGHSAACGHETLLYLRLARNGQRLQRFIRGYGLDGRGNVLDDLVVPVDHGQEDDSQNSRQNVTDQHADPYSP